MVCPCIYYTTKKRGIAPPLWPFGRYVLVDILYHRFAPQTGHFPFDDETDEPHLGQVTDVPLPPVLGFFPLLLNTLEYAFI